MTHLEQYKALFDATEVAFVEETDGEGTILRIGGDEVNMHLDGTVRGYSGFYAEFRFTPAGDFHYVGIWE